MSELSLYLPWRPAALPDAQRLAAWAHLAGWSCRIELVQTLPNQGGPALALGEFTNSAQWIGPQRWQLPASDWAALSIWAEAHLPAVAKPWTCFTDGLPGKEAVLPGEYWVAAEQAGAVALDFAPPEWALLRRWRHEKRRLALAESCTGGGLAARLTALPGSSALLQHGIVSYSNTAKMALLHVREETLARVGAVAEATALEMLEGALREADLAAAITGIAGPGGAVPGKPVGTVCIAWGQRGAAGQVRTCHFTGDRWTVQYAAGSVALGGLLGLLCSS